MKLGKLEPKHDRNIPTLSTYTVNLPAPPASVDYSSKVKKWPMMKNDVLGDCTIAACGHIIQQWTTYNNKPVVFTDDQIIGLYEKITGYNPSNPATDCGGIETNVLNYWLKNGLYQHTLSGYCSLEPNNHNEIMDAIYWFGNVYIGVALPLSAQNQTVWSVPSGGPVGAGTPGSWGGHAVPVVGYDSRGLTVVTWGSLQKMTWQFWNNYCDEAYALLSPDWTESGKNPQGLDFKQLEKDMETLKAVI